jgi:hypothetical protein
VLASLIAYKPFDLDETCFGHWQKFKRPEEEETWARVRREVVALWECRGPLTVKLQGVVDVGGRNPWHLLLELAPHGSLLKYVMHKHDIAWNHSSRCLETGMASGRPSSCDFGVGVITLADSHRLFGHRPAVL